MSIEKEIKERVDFKLSQILESIINHIKRFHQSAFGLALDNKLQESNKAIKYKEAFEIFKEIFIKEINMGMPYDEMYKRKVNIIKNKCIDNIMQRFNEKMRGYLNPSERHNIERFIVNEIQNLTSDLNSL